MGALEAASIPDTTQVTAAVCTALSTELLR